METFFNDVKYSLRVFLKSPGFAFTAVSALALGIGGVIGIFSIVNTVLLKPLDILEPDRVVVLSTTSGSGTGDGDALSPAKFGHFRLQSSVIQDVSAALTGVTNYTGGDMMEQWRSLKASTDAFRCFGIPVLHGRAFAPEEDLPNGPPVVVISQDLWKRRFGGDRSILGKTILLNREPHTVIGIAGAAPSVFDWGLPPEVYLPFQIDPNSNDQADYFGVLARLRPGITVEQARARLGASVVEYRSKFPNVLGPNDGFTAKLLRDDLAGDVRSLLLILLGAVSMVLLIACANVANLLLARATGRRREIAIRTAVGAGRAAMIRHLLTESMLLSLAGGGLGLLLGYGGIRALLLVNTAGLPLVGKTGAGVHLDWRVACFALLISLATALIFGLLPAIQVSRVDVTKLLNNGGISGASLRRHKARAALVLSEMSLALVLLVGAALLIRSFVALYAVDRGFETKNVMTMRVLLAGPRYSKTAGVADTIRAGLEQVRSVPGVVAAGATCCLPLADGTYDLNFDIVGQPAPPLSATQDAGWATVSPGYFDVFRIPVKRGRTFSNRDDGKSPPVVVINERMAQQYWKDRDPVGDRIMIGRGTGINEFGDEHARQIIGIVGNVRDEGLNANPRPIMYVPQAQLTEAANKMFFQLLPMAWLLRAQKDPHKLIPAIREKLRQVTGLPVSDVASMDEVVSQSTGRQRFNLLVMAVFGCSALLLAVIGIYGLMSYTVEERTKEIGIRLALGAEATNVRSMVVRQGMSLAVTGVIVGIGAAWGMSRLIESLLFGVNARDPLVFVGVPVVLIAVAFLAVWLPASRASQVNPIDSLRWE